MARGLLHGVQEFSLNAGSLASVSWRRPKLQTFVGKTVNLNVR